MSKIVHVENNEIPMNGFLKTRQNRIIMLIICTILTVGAIGNFTMGFIDGYNGVELSQENRK